MYKMFTLFIQYNLGEFVVTLFCLYLFHSLQVNRYLSWCKKHYITLKENNYLSLSSAQHSEALVQKAQGITK